MLLYRTRTHRLSVRTRFFARKGRRLLIKTRAPPIIAGHYTFVRCGHPARRIISHHILYCILWEAHTCRHTHTHTHKKVHSAVYWIVIIDTARKSWLISRGIRIPRWVIYRSGGAVTRPYNYYVCVSNFGLDSTSVIRVMCPGKTHTTLSNAIIAVYCNIIYIYIMSFLECFPPYPLNSPRTIHNETIRIRIDCVRITEITATHCGGGIISLYFKSSNYHIRHNVVSGGDRWSWQFYLPSCPYTTYCHLVCANDIVFECERI